jgi:hypothetical protein
MIYVTPGFSSFVSGACVAFALNLATSRPESLRDIGCALVLLVLGAEFSYLSALVATAERHAMVHLVKAPSLSRDELHGVYESELRELRPKLIKVLLLLAVTGCFLAVLLFA